MLKNIVNKYPFISFDVDKLLLVHHWSSGSPIHRNAFVLSCDQSAVVEQLEFQICRTSDELQIELSQLVTLT